MKIIRSRSGPRTMATLSMRMYASAHTGTCFSGACGHTYGNHSVWQMYAPGRRPDQRSAALLVRRDSSPRCGTDAICARARSNHVRTFPEFLIRASIANALEGADHISATRGEDYAFIYSAQGRKFTVNMGKISGS